MSKKFLTLQPEGTSDRPRFSIMDDEGNHLDERNDSWGDRDKATLYANAADGCRKIQNILLEKFGNVPNRRFVVPLFVDLYCEDEVTSKQVADWLYQVTRIATDVDRHGLGPVAESLGLLNIDWDLLREMDNAKKPIG